MYTQQQEKQAIDDNDFYANGFLFIIAAAVAAPILLLHNGGVDGSMFFGAVVIGLIGGHLVTQESAASGPIGFVGLVGRVVVGFAGGAVVGGVIGYFFYSVGSGYGGGELIAFGAIVIGVIGGHLAVQESAAIGASPGERIRFFGGPVGFARFVGRVVVGFAGGAVVGGITGYFVYSVGSGYGGGEFTAFGAIIIGASGGYIVAQEGAEIGARFGGKVGLLGGLIGFVAGLAGGAALGGAIGYFAYSIGSGHEDASSLIATSAVFGAIVVAYPIALEGVAIGARFRERIGLLGGLIVLVAGFVGGAIVGGALGAAFGAAIDYFVASIG